MRRLAGAASALAVAGFLLVGLLMFVPVWPCTMLEHFRVQYLLGGVAIAAAAFWLSPRWFDAALIALLLDLVIVAPDLGSTTRDRGGTRVRVLFSNVLASNTSYDKVAALIAETKPDIVALVETRAPWFEKLAPVLAGYQRIEHDRPDNFGLGLYARGTVTGKVEHIGGELPTIVAKLALERGPTLTFVVTHPWPPVSGWAEDRQYEHLAAIAERLDALPRPLVFAGDLNATPWTRVFRKLAGTTGLCDTRAGFGYQGSFPASSAIVRIPIDHVLVSCDVGVHDRWSGTDVGSDHLPVVVDLVF